jgi:foldase protein PrsA
MDNKEIDNTPVVPVGQESPLFESEPGLKAPEADVKEVKPKKKIKIGIIILVVLVIGIVALDYYSKGMLIAATVNGSPISRLAVIAELEKSAGKTTLDSLITKKLIEAEVVKKGFLVSQDDVSAEIKKVEEEVKAQNLTLDQALAQQGMTLEDFQTQIFLHLELEKLLADKIQVTQAEIDQYIIDKKITIPAGQETIYQDQVKNKLQQQKLSEAAGQLIDTLRTQAKINYYVKY